MIASDHTPNPPSKTLPRFIQKLLKMESISGMVMLVATILAFFTMNSPLKSWYNSFVNLPITFRAGNSEATHSLADWVKDILMVFFFLQIGLELKREMLIGFLKERSQIMLPLVAAIGGMFLPAGIYLLCNLNHQEYWHGWAIPSATDIAFAVGILMLIAKNIPKSAKIFLLAIAIFDDIGAILIILAFYSNTLVLGPLVLAIIGLMALWWLNRQQITQLMPYFLVGAYLWFCFYQGGIHTTMAGVCVAIAIPLKGGSSNYRPLEQCLHFLHPWIAFFVLPIFAFTNAGIDLSHLHWNQLTHSVPLGITLGLFFGKQIGILGLTRMMVFFKWASRPADTSWWDIYIVSIIAGIGFTMSLFIGLLAFPEAYLQEEIKVGVLMGSLFSAVWGILVAYWIEQRRKKKL